MADDEIRARVDAFVGDLSALIRKAALDAVQEALGSSGGSSSSAPRRGRPPAAAAPVAAKRGPAPKAGKKPAGRKPGQKRDPQILEALVEKLFGYIKAHPAQRIEQIGVGLDLPTKELTLPIKKLLRAKRITAKGVKRSTTYAPVVASGGGGLVLVKKRKKADGGSADASK